MAPTIKTVLGEISPSELGRTLTHEHLSMQFGVSYVAPKEKDMHLVDLPWKMENLGWIRQFPYSHLDNITLNDGESESAVLESVGLFKSEGGGAIVENSTFGLYRKTPFLKEVSKQTGVHVIAGTGYYVGPSHFQETFTMTVEDMAKVMMVEMVDGCQDDSSVKAGIIGEIGCSFPILDIERKAIQASAEVQEALHCPVSFHPGRDPESPFEIVRIFLEAGGKPSKTIMGHLERTISDPDQLAEFAELGLYCQFDLFGTENSYYQIKEDLDFPSDAQRIKLVQRLIAEGREDKILLSHDIHTKHRLESFGGHGYKHLLTITSPKMLVKGISQTQIDKMFIGNPAQVLAYE